MSTTPVAVGLRGISAPTPTSQRALAPDVARGLMLLLIALANIPWFLYATNVGVTIVHAAGGSIGDQVAQAITIIAVDGRSYTLFGLLFGYGIVQLWARQRSHGVRPSDARRLLRRRHWWMIAIGLVHVALLWQGDILTVYGILGLLLVPIVINRSDRTVRIWIIVLLSLGLAFSLAMGAASLIPAETVARGSELAAAGTASYPTSILLRLVLWAPSLLGAFAILSLPTAFLVGILAARHRILENPAAHLPLLRRVAIGGISVGWGVGTLQFLVHTGTLSVPNPDALSMVHTYAGIFAGIGYAAIFGLIAHRLAKRSGGPGAVVGGLVALGRRSMSGYLAQSLLFAPLLSAWGLGLGAHLTSATAAIAAIATWLLTVVIASWMDRTGHRGPAEVLLRRLSYRPRRGI